MTKIIFKTRRIFKEFEDIFNNENFTLKRHWIKRVVFWKTINSKWNIQYKTAKKLLDIYNEYYNLHKKIESIFIKEKILNYQKNVWREVIFEYIDDWNYSLFKFIDEILALA